MLPPPSQDTVGICNQITLLILYYISSRLVILLEVIDAPIQVRNIFFYLTVIFKFLNFCFQIFLLFVPECLLPSHLTLCRLCTLLWFGSCNHCILACFPWSNKHKRFSSNHGLCCFNSCRHRLSVAEVLIFSLMFSQAQFMSSPTGIACSFFSLLFWNKNETFFLIFKQLMFAAVSININLGLCWSNAGIQIINPAVRDSRLLISSNV